MKVSIHLEDLNPEEAAHALAALGAPVEPGNLKVVKGGKSEKTEEASPKKETAKKASSQKAEKAKEEEPVDENTGAAEALEEDQTRAEGLDGDLGEIAKELEGVNRFRDVLVTLIDEGYASTEQELIDICTNLKDHVPVLRKVGNLPERIKRVATVLQLGDKKSA